MTKRSILPQADLDRLNIQMNLKGPTATRTE